MLKKFILLFSSLILLSSCAETAIIATITTGVMVSKEKSAKNTAKDLILYNKIKAKFIKNPKRRALLPINIEVSEGRVLLTGIVKNRAVAIYATQLAFSVKGTKEVINELQSRKKTFLLARPYHFLRDSIISARAKSSLLFNKEIRSNNYEVVVLHRNVYVFGIARSKRELKLALKPISKIRGVQKVISHVILKNDARRKS